MSPNSEIFLDALCLAVYAPTEDTYSLLQKLVDEYNRDAKDNATLVNPITQFYIAILEEILTSGIAMNNKAELAVMLLKFKQHPVVIEDSTMLTKLQEVFATETVSQRRITCLQKKIQNWIIWNRGNNSLRRMFSKSQKCTTMIDQAQQDVLLHEILDHARDMVKAYESSSVSLDDTIDMIDMSNKDSVSRAFITQKSKRKTNILKCGWQALNRMIGYTMGFPRGAFAAFAARSHNYKSGILMDITRWICTLNNPNISSNEIPCVVFISFENEIYDNLMKWFRSAYVNAYHDSSDHLTDDEIIAYVTEVYSKRGFRLLVFRRLGEMFGYEDLIRLLAKLKLEGYKVVGLLLDYLTLMKTDDDKYNAAKQIQNLAQKIGNFCKHSGILGVTGFQLDTEADKIAASGRTNIVKQYRAAHLGDCKGLFREMEFLAYLEIENNHLGVPYLTCALGKNRIDETVPAKDRYFAMRFTPYGIMNDIDGKDTSVQDIYDSNLKMDDDDVAQPDKTAIKVSLF